jgi:hypothetical protein
MRKRLILELTCVLLCAMPRFCLADGNPAWIRPIGIPEPTFGIRESHTMYQDQQYNYAGVLGPYKNAGYGPYTHYIDNSHPSATDSGNPHGTVEKPRLTIPLNLSAGSVVEIHGGPYTYGNYNGNTYIGINADGSASQPVFVRGIANPNRPIIQRSLWLRGHYVIVEGFDFNRNLQGGGAIRIQPWPSTNPDPVGYVHHLSVRDSEAHHLSKATSGNSAMFSASGILGNDVTDVVFYNNNVHPDDVDIYNPPDLFEKDTVGIGMGSYSSRVWIVDNHIHHSAGDSVGTGHDARYTARNYYIGRNRMHDNGENAVDLKEVENVIVSQNLMYNMFGPSSGSDGSVVVVHYGPNYWPKNTWFLFNEIFNASNSGIQVGGTVLDDVYFIGNLVHDISNASGTAKGFSSWGSRNIHLAGNVFYNVDNGINITGSGSTGRLFFHNNIVSKLLNLSGFHMSLSDSTYRAGADVRNNLFFQPEASVRINWGSASSPSSVAQLRAAGYFVNCLEADPMFVQASANNFRLQSTSPAIDAGMESGLYALFKSTFGVDINVDYDLKPRPQGLGWDIGAYEFVPPVIDSDGDGLVDTWEIQYFDSVSDPRAQPGVDVDGDGFDNQAEQSAGTSPVDGSSRLVITNQNFVVPSNFTVQWTAAPGKIYKVEYSTTLTNWATAVTITNSSNASLQWTDDGSQTGGAPSGSTKRFYRVRIP